MWSESGRNFTMRLVLILIALLAPFTVAGQTKRYAVATGQ